jgi:hypothetical protein
MPTDLVSPALQEFLGRVRSHLPLSRGGDIAQELESSVRDRVDDLAAAAGRAPDEDLVRRALAEVGEPETVAAAYVKQRALVGPAEFRAFAVWTALAFAVHLSLVGVATMLERAVVLGPVTIAPEGSHGLVSLAAAAVHALLVDVGLMTFVFAGTGRLRRRIHGTAVTPQVETSPRAMAARIALSVLVALVLTVFRDRLFVVVTGNETYPLFTEWFVAVVPLVTAVLALAVASDALYLVAGETRLTLAVDAAHGLAALACMLFLLRGDAILALPRLEQFGAAHVHINRFLGDLGTLVVGFLALVFAVKTVRRLVRFAQI